jgi:hypothetical protein
MSYAEYLFGLGVTGRILGPALLNPIKGFAAIGSHKCAVMRWLKYALQLLEEFRQMRE